MTNFQIDRSEYLCLQESIANACIIVIVKDRSYHTAQLFHVKTILNDDVKQIPLPFRQEFKHLIKVSRHIGS